MTPDLEVVGEPRCLVTLAGDSDRLTGNPQQGDPVLLSLRSRSFCARKHVLVIEIMQLDSHGCYEHAEVQSVHV